MEDKLKILIIEDDTFVCTLFQNLMDNMHHFYLVGITNNSKKAISLIEDCLPDVVILDLELHAGGGNGIDVLQGVQGLCLPYLPFFLITTNNTSSTTYEITRTLGADFIMYKNETGYSEQNVLDFLNIISSTIKKKSFSKPFITESSQQQSKRLTKRIHSYLDLIGISPKVKGYAYLTDAILLVYNGSTYHLCDKIALLYKKSEASVERAMQNAINKAWNTSDIDILSKYYTGKIHSQRGMPTVTEFAHYYANLLKDI